MTPEQLSALSDIVNAAKDKLHYLVGELGPEDELVSLTTSSIDMVQLYAERISEEAFNLVELLATAQEEDYD